MTTTNLTLNYHGLHASSHSYNYLDCEKPYVVSLSQFEKQLDQLLASRTPVQPDKLEGEMNGLPDTNSFLLTFDDGHRSHYDLALKVLREKNLKAIFFVSAGLVGSSDLMTWGQLQEVIHEGHLIGSHGLSHIPLKDLSQEDLEREVSGSKELLEHKLDIEINSFSIPRGYSSSRVLALAKKAGYKKVYTSEFGYNTSQDDLMRVKRIPVLASTTDKRFECWAKGQLGTQLYREQFKSVVRRSIPSQVYDQLARLKRSMT